MVVLLTSELVTRAVMLCERAADEFVELRVWMPPNLVRVELRGARELLCAPAESEHPHDDLVLVDGLADRWAIDADDDDACIWFEIDRHADVPRGRARRDGPFAAMRRR